MNLAVRQLRNPIVILLLVAATMSLVFDAVVDSVVILVIVVASAALGWVQERGAVHTVDALLDSVRIHAEVLRDGRVVEVEERSIVPGDVIIFNAGDVVPADCRLIETNLLMVNEAALTGESSSREKSPGVITAETPVGRRSNMLLHGSHVSSGRGVAVAVACGADTEFGKMASHVMRTHVPTAFERGVAQYGRMLAEVTVALVAVVFVVNFSRGRPLLASVMFSLALAVGIAPQMLPAVVTTCLASGARLLARHHVVVKRLDSIEDIGSIDTLCVDKTGTLTTGVVSLVRWCDVAGEESPVTLELATWNAALQRGFSNQVDEAILQRSGARETLPELVAEIPFDFSRRLVSVIVRDGGGLVLVAKGDVAQILERCSVIDPADRRRLDSLFATLSHEGYRVLAVASRPVGEIAVHDTSDDLERELTFVGFLAFDDPIKPDVVDALSRLGVLGIGVKVMTGDSRLAARHVARASGLDEAEVLTGWELSALDEASFSRAADRCDVFAEIDPLMKERLVRTLSLSGRTVGFLGDGVNDAAALHSADIGISVDGGVDVAKRVADVILMEKDLTVLADAVRRGRRVFANTLTYVKVTTSANFGNMVSLACATTFLPDLPLLPLQILLLNFLSDIPGLSVAVDVVEPERVARPGRWNVGQVGRFMIVFGLISTVADLATFGVLLKGRGGEIVDVRTGWFAVSLLTEVAALLVLRTARPAWRSKPGSALAVTSAAVGLIAASVPFGLLPDVFGFERLDVVTIACLAGVVAAYVVVTECVKWRRPSLVTDVDQSPV